LNTNLQHQLYKSLWESLDWLFPPNCGGCGVSGTRWCTDCKQKVHTIHEPICISCGLPQEDAGLCTQCGENPPAYKFLRSWTIFADPIQGALHRLKYRRDVGLGEALSSQVARFVAQLNWPIDTLIPIPLGKKRLKERGYNQVAMIAMPLSIQLGLKYLPGALSRARETRSQVGLSAVERQENVQSAFLADDRKVRGQTILLIDDVATTGATLSSAAEALYHAGAQDVHGITIARALPHQSSKKVWS
jgi:ComF family protein